VTPDGVAPGFLFMGEPKEQLLMEKDASNRFALYTPIQKVEPQGDGSLLVSGWGSVSNYIDSQGDFPDPDALKSAAIDWGTHWGNIRLQHDAGKPIGSARKADHPGAEISIRKHPDTGSDSLWLVSHIVDADGISKVKSGTLKGYSMGGMINPGGRVLGELDGKQAYCLKDFTIDEVSLVDKPACNLATVEHVSLAKRDIMPLDIAASPATTTATETNGIFGLDQFIDEAKPEEKGTILKFMARLFGKVNSVLTAAKADDVPTVKEERKPITGEQLQKDLYAVGHVAHCVARLDELVWSGKWESFAEGDESSIPGRLAAARDQLGEILVAMVEEEVSELSDGTEDQGEVTMALTAKAAELLASINGGVEKNASGVEKAAAEKVEKAGRVMSAAMKGQLSKAAGHLTKAQDATDKIGDALKAGKPDEASDHLSNLEAHHGAIEKCHGAMQKMAGETSEEPDKVDGSIDEVGTLEGKSAKLGDMIKAAVVSSIEPLQKQLTEVTTANAKLQAENETLKAVNKALGDQPATPKARIFAVRPGVNADEINKGAAPEGTRLEDIDPKDPKAAQKAIVAQLRKGGQSVLSRKFNGSAVPGGI